MARLEDIDALMREELIELECPEFKDDPWVTAPALADCRVAVISTAGLQRRDDRPFELGTADYRVILGETVAEDLIMSHVSTNFDRAGYQQDMNVCFPIDRLNELAAEGVIGSVAKYHYSFMGATEPEEMEAPTRQLAGLLKADDVNAVLLVPI
ncbi:MAG: glycine/sarcosine/betaine reductase selenoprotein B family protein [Alphaproteobacteria bacterium]|jgi:D-proline reductase (dithiol) PrdB|nr:glycine/sarcosine/betaine reductase selenoprotein B family protein [Alphaproteobacteria bacterium]